MGRRWNLVAPAANRFHLRPTNARRRFIDPMICFTPGIRVRLNSFATFPPLFPGSCLTRLRYLRRLQVDRSIEQQNIDRTPQ